MSAFRDMLAADLAKAEAEAGIKSYDLPNNWEPRPYQQPAWDFLKAGGKRVCLNWHRRAGKDSFALNWTAVASDIRVGDYWHMFPQQAQARKALWDGTNPDTGERLIHQAFPDAMVEARRDMDMFMRLRNGSTWRLVGSDNYDQLVGSTPAGIVFSEWALADPMADAFLRPILAASNGWAIYISTPRGSNHFRSTYETALANPGRWFAQTLTADDTDVFTAEKLNDELLELKKLYGDDDGLAHFNQEYFCSWIGAFAGSYFGANLAKMQREGRIGNVPFEPGVPVHTAWDLGISDSTAIWFIQRCGREYRIVDFHEGSGVGLDEYAGVLEEKRRQRRWSYGNHYFPHDISVRELGNRGRSRVDTLRSLGVVPKVVPVSNVNDGINAVRQILDQAWIDEKHCSRGLNALREYRREWSEKNKAFADRPKHDWTSHACDALRTFACGYRDRTERAVMPSSSGYGSRYGLPVYNSYGVGRGNRGGGSNDPDKGTGWMRR
jgi:phage terminase large subunit